MYMGCSYIHTYHIETRKTLDDFFVQVRNLLLTLSLKVFRHKERGHNLSILAFSSAPTPNTCGTRHKGLREQAKTNRLVRCPVLNSLTFSKSPKILRALPVRGVIRPV